MQIFFIIDFNIILFFLVLRLLTFESSSCLKPILIPEISYFPLLKETVRAVFGIRVETSKKISIQTLLILEYWIGYMSCKFPEHAGLLRRVYLIFIELRRN